MNRAVMIGGVSAVVVLLGAAGYFAFFRDNGGSSSDTTTLEAAGPTTLNPVTVITEHTPTQSEDRERLAISFPSFELAARAGQTASSVFSASWSLDIKPEDRVVVAAATVKGFLKSAGTPPAEPAAAPAATTPAGTTAPAPSATTTTSTAPAEGTPVPAPATTPATDPAAPAAEAAKPTPKPPAGPVAGDGAARLTVTVGSETFTGEWHDTTGAGAEHALSKAVSFIGAASDVKAGGKVPVTVTLEVTGGSSVDTLARVNTVELRLFTEPAPLPAPAPGPAASPADGSTPATGDSTTTLAPPPAETATPAPAPAPAQ